MVALSAYMMYNILEHNFQFTYIWSYSSKNLPLHLLISTFYAGQEGSFMLWTLLLSLIGVFLLPFAKKHDNVTMAVFNKSADAGGIREDDLDKMKDKVDLSQLRIVGYTDYFPNWPLYATPKLSKDKAAKIKAALLKLKPNDAQATKVLNPAKLTGFSPVTDKDYDSLRKAVKLVGEL